LIFLFSFEIGLFPTTIQKKETKEEQEEESCCLLEEIFPFLSSHPSYSTTIMGEHSQLLMYSQSPPSPPSTISLSNLSSNNQYKKDENDDKFDFIYHFNSSYSHF